ncbi:MAG: magnesium transporter MgtE N-terminal domain-containing protein [Aestuariibacter sp.]
MSTLDMKLAQYFLQEEPRGAARRLEMQEPKVAAEVLKTLTIEAAVNVLKAMHPRSAAEALMTLPDVTVAKWLEKIKLADIAAIFRHLSDTDFTRLLDLLSVKKQTLCRMLVSYPDYTVGAWVETDVFVLDDKMKVDEALLRLRKRHFAGIINIYVVNQQRQVVGQVSLYDLLRKAKSQSIAEIMDTKIQYLSGYTGLFSASKSSVWSEQDHVAVINRHREFIGALQHHRLRSALGRIEDFEHKPLESADLFDAYVSSFTSMMDVLIPSTDPQEGNQ